MSKLIMLLRVVAVLAVLGIGGAFWQESSLVSKAQLIQRMKPHDSAVAALLGEVGTPIGDPQRMIIEDETVFLTGSGTQGQRFVDDDAMKAKEIYPLQEKTVKYVAGLVKIGALASAVGSLVLAWWLGRRRRA